MIRKLSNDYILISFHLFSSQAHWGAALTYSHPVWDFIKDYRLEYAAARSELATACAATAAAANSALTTREQAYLASLAVYTNLTDPLVAEPADRLQAFADDLYNRVYLPFPADSNAG